MAKKGCWILRETSVSLLRDVAQIVEVVILVLALLSPTCYPTAALPEECQGFMSLNPLTLVIKQCET